MRFVAGLKKFSEELIVVELCCCNAGLKKGLVSVVGMKERG